VERLNRTPDPVLPEEITGDELDRDLKRELSTLGSFISGIVARHLVMASALVDIDPDLAWEHAEAASRRAGRLGSVREIAGVTAYRSGRYAEALRELRTARRLTGSDDYLPMIADCERGMGRPERALEIAGSPEAARLSPAERVEMLIVAAGARVDRGEASAAVAMLQIGELDKQGRTPVRDRLRAAYSFALEAAGRPEEAAVWRERAGLEDEAEELAALEDSDIFDLMDDAEPDPDDTDPVAEAGAPMPDGAAPKAEQPEVVEPEVVEPEPAAEVSQGDGG
jgi:hypothetical protein